MIRAWIQRMLGDQPELVALREVHARLVVELDEANRRVYATEIRLVTALNERNQAREAYSWFLEGAPHSECQKTRFETSAGAQEMADRLRKLDGAAMKVYRCKFCPRHPFTTARYWHVAHVQPRAQRPTILPRREGRGYTIASTTQPLEAG